MATVSFQKSLVLSCLDVCVLHLQNGQGKHFERRMEDVAVGRRFSLPEREDKAADVSTALWCHHVCLTSFAD